MYKHIIWDFDGTLFDTYPVMAETFKETLEKNGIEEPLEKIMKQMKVSMTHTFNYYGEKYGIGQEFIAAYDSRRKEVEFDLSKPFEGMVELCKYIHETGRRNYLYTHRGESSMKMLEDFGMTGYFSDFITSEHGFERKPSPDAIQHLIRTHHIDHSEAIMIGDRNLDLESGKNAGISSCYFTDVLVENPHADYVVTSVEDLYKII
ncbi:phosphoglycolate phosphatase [Bacillus sp. AFS015802]|uniref:HAD-IA family hydrolase n=1 Tax=Bacillus sp. AFS015802 TaxID=2033486 RepID=UPI000BF6B2E6|nr:HAD-IA family hydrolase [Bacillus sp. AFS015802]PFA62792.1 phosphoglycolate phosphatase [Bacillus sp. AFS015802]